MKYVLSSFWVPQNLLTQIFRCLFSKYVIVFKMVVNFNLEQCMCKCISKLIPILQSPNAVIFSLMQTILHSVILKNDEIEKQKQGAFSDKY